MQGVDSSLFRAINDLVGRSDLWDEVFVLASEYGIYIFGLILLVYLLTDRKVFWAGLVSAVLARGFFTPIIRFFYNRDRPFAALEDVNQLVEKSAAEGSFPSGHAVVYFAIALAVFTRNKKTGYVLLALALVFSFARIYTGIHYPFDVVASIVVAAVAVLLINKFIKPK